MIDDDAAARLGTLLSSATDAGLSDMSIEALLAGTLERIRGILDTDTIAVLLREPNAPYLVARVACGLEDEVRQGVRVPIGTGFAGSIAAHREPVILDRVDETTVTNPILWEKGIRTMLGVPLVLGDELLGVVHVGRLDERRFAQHDVQLLQLAGDRIAAALHSRQLAIDAAAGQLLERGLLPPRLPEIEGLQFAARYVPAESRNVGGDWYDAFVLPSGELWAVIGDVAGHGMDAAVVMGRVKSALRSYALLGTTPEQAVTLTDQKVLHFELGTLVTLVVAALTPPYDTMRICSAGHPPPVLAAPGQPARLLVLPVGQPLGVGRDPQRRSRSVALPPGALAVFYTDGLIERRDRPIDDGLETLRNVTTATHPDAACYKIMHSLVGSRPTEDDIAILALRRSA